MNDTLHQKVWKVGSRWDPNGSAEKCILDLFRAHHVAFVGWNYDAFADIKKGDLVAVSSGLKVVAMGTALEDAQPFSELGITLSPAEQERVHPDDVALGCRIDFQDLDPEDFVSYRMGTIHGVNERAEQFRQLAQKLKESKEGGQFAINARSCTLLESGTVGHESLLSANKHYRIPVYQRPYSWGEPEVSRLLRDLLTAFKGDHGQVPREPIFIGTLQITAGQPIDETLKKVRHDVIDGQQRLTTLSLLLRTLQLCSPGLEIITGWLESEVGGGFQQAAFQEALIAGDPSNLPHENNRYLSNLNLILKALNEEFQDKEGLIDSAAISDFYQYLASRVWFVVIETRAGLSKTLQIFDSINTSGMDLDGTDIFKIRYFEYLREAENPNKLEDKELFETVAELYTAADRYSEEGIVMESVLNVAKWNVATRLGLSVTAKESRGTTFFERFFDTVLNVQRWDAFSEKSCKKILTDNRGPGLPVALFHELMGARISWEERWPKLPPEALAMSYFMWWSRYENYATELVTLFIWKLKPSDEELAQFVVKTGKLMIALSVIYQKITSGRRMVIYNLFEELMREDSTAAAVAGYIDKLCRLSRDDLAYSINHDPIAHLPKSKTLLCRLVAVLDELESGSPDGKAFCNLLFNSQVMEIDIEHIESVNHRDGTKREDTWESWGDELHRLGNLTVLERTLNRQIKNIDYATEKRTFYRNSEFATVKNFAERNLEWSPALSKARKEALAETLTSYLCGPAPVDTTL